MWPYAVFGKAAGGDPARSWAGELGAEAGAHTSTLRAADGGPKVGGYMLFRYLLNSRDDSAIVEDTTNGFQTSKFKLSVSGDAGDYWSYSLLGNFSHSSGVFGLQDAVVTYKVHDVDDRWSVRAGQFKLPLLREELILDTTQLAVDRSATNSVFTQNRSQGIELRYAGESTRFFAALSDGLSTLNSDFDSAAEADYAFTGRCEWMFAGGDWARFTDFTSFKGSAYAGLLGGAAHFQSGGDTFATGGTTTDAGQVEVTGDVQVEGDGWNAFGAVVFRTVDPAAGSSTDDLGFVAQGGWMFGDHWEVFGRWDSVIPDDPAEDFSTLTLGVNYYVVPASHAVKFTVDAQYFLDEQSASIVPASTLVGLLPSAEDGQWVLRVQAQVRF